MRNKHKAAPKAVRYESYATNIRIQGMAVVLCKMPYEEKHGDPETVSKVIGDALEFYYKNKQSEIEAMKDKSEPDKKELANDKI